MWSFEPSWPPWCQFVKCLAIKDWNSFQSCCWCFSTKQKLNETVTSCQWGRYSNKNDQTTRQLKGILHMNNMEWLILFFSVKYNVHIHLVHPIRLVLKAVIFKWNGIQLSTKMNRGNVQVFGFLQHWHWILRGEWWEVETTYTTASNASNYIQPSPVCQ